MRSLKAHNYDLKKATGMMEAHLKWRKVALPIPEEEVKVTVATRKFYMIDELDQEGRPVIVYSLHRMWSRMRSRRSSTCWTLASVCHPMLTEATNFDHCKITN